MSSVVLVLRDPDERETSLRCDAMAAFTARLQSAAGESTTVISGADEPTAILTDLAADGRLVRRDDQLCYVPSRSARDRVAGDEDGIWPKSVASRQRKQLRRSQGAIYHFPLEGDDAASVEAASVDAFVTDWTGLPSACAIAVHPAHPLSPGLTEGAAGSFTGRYCRNPLTGDLLPIWVAAWVKPEFGTGAVLLNPGHNQVDLDFSRAVGLPVRFSLQPESGEWMQPPFIRSGVAVRSGIADGMTYDQAGNRYIQAVMVRGLAERRTDYGMGMFPVAQVSVDGALEVPWDPDRRTVPMAAGPSTTIDLDPWPVLGAAEPAARDADLTIVTASPQIEDSLLATRLLLAEAIEPAVKSAPQVILVGNAVSPKEPTDDEVLRLALLVSVGTQETAAIKPQQAEPCDRFLKVHGDLLRRHAEPGQGASPEVARPAGQVKSLIVRSELKQAFTQLYRIQKVLAKDDQATEGDMVHYGALAYVLAGVETPYPREALQATWQAL